MGGPPNLYPLGKGKFPFRVPERARMPGASRTPAAAQGSASYKTLQVHAGLGFRVESWTHGPNDRVTLQGYDRGVGVYAGV